MTLQSPGLYRQAIEFVSSGPAVRQSPAQSKLQRAVEEAAASTDLRNCQLTANEIVGPEEDVMLVALRLDDLQTDFGLQIKLRGEPMPLSHE